MLCEVSSEGGAFVLPVFVDHTVEFFLFWHELEDREINRG